MSEDVDARLEELERRLRALREEVGAPGHAPRGERAAPAGPASGQGTGPHARAKPEPPPGGTPVPDAGHAPPVDPLEQFGIELRRLAEELLAAWDRVAAQARAPKPRRSLVLEAQADLHDLAALEHALMQAPGVSGVELRAYAAGRASLRVDLA